MNIYKKIAGGAFWLSTWLWATAASAAPIGTALLDGSETKKLIDKFGGQKDITTAIYGIVSVLLSFLGVIFAGFIIYAGFLWMTDNGDEKQAEKARTIMKNSIIGMVIVVAAYIITYFVVQSIAKAVTGTANSL